MTIKQAGVQCDICGEYIFGILGANDNIQEFSVPQCEHRLHCHAVKCKQVLADISDSDGNWERLPDGPLKKAFAEIASEIEAEQCSHY